MSLKKRFAGHEAEILTDVDDLGIEGAMTKWNAKNYLCWVRYIDELKAGYRAETSTRHRRKNSTKLVEKRTNSQATPLRLWGIITRDEILKYEHKYGFMPTCTKYRLSPATLVRMLAQETKDNKALATAEVAMAGVSELRKEVRELEEQIAEFHSSIAEQIKIGFLIPLLQSSFHLPESLELPPKFNPLSLEALGLTPDVPEAETLLTQAKKGSENAKQ